MATAGGASLLHLHVTVVRNKATLKLLYLEAGKDFVDLLLSVLFLPVGVVVARLNGQSVVPVPAALGAISNISKSIDRLTGLLNVPEAIVLQPTVSLQSRECVQYAAGVLGMSVASHPQSALTLYSCGSINYYSGDCHEMNKFEGNVCSKCKSARRQKFQVPEAIVTSGPGLVKEYRFIVTDDLQIIPASTDACFDLLRSLGVQSMHNLENSTVQLSTQKVSTTLPWIDTICKLNAFPQATSMVCGHHYGHGCG